MHYESQNDSSTTASRSKWNMAMDEWSKVLAPQSILIRDDIKSRYRQDTSHFNKTIAAVLLPTSRDEVQALVRIAQKHAIALYPISTGRNWGYGSALPCQDDCVLVDLSCLRTIIAIDHMLGIVTVEPGVTQADLQRYLDENRLDFMVPVTGAGPGCSLVGNALERGYGITPYVDHCMSIMAIEAVLPSGELYRSTMTSLLGNNAHSAFKWGIGPYFDGLFAQGNFGIVTQMSIALVKRPHTIQAFYFWVDQDERLEATVTAIQEILTTCGSNVGGINLISNVRMLAMSVPYPLEQVDETGLLPDSVVNALATENNISPWMGVGSIYGSKAHAHATRKTIRKLLKPHVKRILFIDRSRIRLLEKILRIMPSKPAKKLGRLIHKMACGLELIEGRPNEVALPLAYWKSKTPPPETDLNPARDGCGLLWYAPIVPMQADAVRCYVNLTRKECKIHGIEPAITLTAISERAFDSTLPILFDCDDERSAQRATEFYRTLFQKGKIHGFVPYRINNQFMDLVIDPKEICWQMGTKIKHAIDPNGIMAPGRYSMV